jgi:hypothetical protein
MIEHISRSAITFIHKGRKIVIKGELFLDPPGDWNGGCFEAPSNLIKKWESGDDVTDVERSEILRALTEEIKEKRLLKKLEIF